MKKAFTNTFLIYSIFQLIFIIFLNYEKNYLFLIPTSVPIGMFLGYFIKYNKLLSKKMRNNGILFLIFELFFVLSVFIFDKLRIVNLSISLLLMIYLYYISFHLVKHNGESNKMNEKPNQFQFILCSLCLLFSGSVSSKRLLGTEELPYTSLAEQLITDQIQEVIRMNNLWGWVFYIILPEPFQTRQ